MKKKTQKKDFEKKSHKVGQRKVRSNDTSAKSVSSRRVVMPSQNLEKNGDVIGEALVGLKHYNEKKRLDAINSLMRFGHLNITDDYLGECLLTVGYCLCDDDEMVRSKCSSFLYQMLDELDRVSLQPFFPKVCVQIRAGLGHVASPIRADSIRFLSRVIDFNIFEEKEVNQIVRTLVELNNTFLIAHSGVKGNLQKGGKQSEADVRFTLWLCIESLLNLLVEKRRMMEDDGVEASQWTITNLLSRVFSPSDSIAPEVQKLLASLTRLGEDEMRDRIEVLATELGLLTEAKPAAESQPSAQDKNAKKKPQTNQRGSVFSRLSSLMNASDSD